MYTSTGLSYYRHADWLGSSRFASTTSRAMYSSTAYTPFGQPYAQVGTADLNFTGMNSDTSGSSYDFLARQYGTQGRWPSPDPAGLAAANPTNPQSWNRYAYALNNPLALVDPLGLDPCEGANWFPFSQAANGTGIFTPEDCVANGGIWDSSGNGFFGPGAGNGDPAAPPGNPTPGCEWQTDENGITTVKCEDHSSGGGSILVALSKRAAQPPPTPTISAGPADYKQKYCSHQADLAALEELLPGITRGQYESTPKQISKMTAQHLALDAVATRSLWQRWIRWKTGIPMTKTAKLAERATIILLLYDLYETWDASKEEYQTCMAH